MDNTMFYMITLRITWKLIEIIWWTLKYKWYSSQHTLHYSPIKNYQSHNFVIPLRPTFSFPMISINLPGVAHNMLQPCTICRIECPNCVPPYMTTALTQVLLIRKMLLSSYLKIRHFFITEQKSTQEHSQLPKKQNFA